MQKTIGLIGGMSWQSSLKYYQIINEETSKRLGGEHSARCLMYSFDFAELTELQLHGRHQELQHHLVAVAQTLEKGGADFLLICANTAHKYVDEVQKTISIPIVHIVGPTAIAIQQRGITKIGLLGTSFTMEEDFYKGRLTQDFDLEVIIPSDKERQSIHTIIFEELCCGILRKESKARYLEIIHQLGERGAQGIILGCTEIGLLVQQDDTQLPLFDTTRLHAEAAVALALK